MFYIQILRVKYLQVRVAFRFLRGPGTRAIFDGGWETLRILLYSRDRAFRKNGKVASVESISLRDDGTFGLRKSDLA